MLVEYSQLLALPMIFLAIGFFLGVRFLLGLFGISIFPNQIGPPRRA